MSVVSPRRQRFRACLQSQCARVVEDMRDDIESYREHIRYLREIGSPQIGRAQASLRETILMRRRLLTKCFHDCWRRYLRALDFEILQRGEKTPVSPRRRGLPVSPRTLKADYGIERVTWDRERDCPALVFVD